MKKIVVFGLLISVLITFCSCNIENAKSKKTLQEVSYDESENKCESIIISNEPTEKEEIICSESEASLVSSKSDESSVSEDSNINNLINIALKKNYTYTGQCFIGDVEQYPDDKTKKLTDGVSGQTNDIGYNSPIWVGLHLWCGDLGKGVCNEIVVDLGSKASKLTKFAFISEICDSGIERPEQVEIYISDDNSVYTYAGIAEQNLIVKSNYYTNPDYGIYAYSVSLSDPVSARYVKFKIKHTANWVFVSEVEVFQKQD